MASDIAFKIDNRYEVLGELGRGGMGIVYKANDLKMDRLVAIKVMTVHTPGRDEYQERFLREAKAIAKMQHPNIVVVHDFGYHSGAPYIGMEYVDGIPLDKVIASRVSLTPLAKVNFVVQVCHALHYAHQLGIVHRDVKPGNIMILDAGRRVKLLDFGIARAGGASNLSKSGLAMGTTCYMSPEQTKGQKDLDGRADIFSAGVVLYELLTGKPPWTGPSDYEIMTKVIHEPFPPLSGSYHFPPGLDPILERALAKDRNARYETAEKMAQDLCELEVPLKEQALEEALVQFEHGDLLRANDLVSQILRIDTHHREAIELRGKLQQMAHLQQRSEQVRQLRTTAEEAVGQKRFTEALAAVDQAMTIDSANTELFHYRELIRHEVKRREDIRKKLELARRAQEINDLSTAEELVDKALEVDPTDTQARMMKSTLEQERKRQQVQEIADEASRNLAVRAFPRAKEFIEHLEALDPNYALLASLKKALLEGEAEERRRFEIENLIREIRRVLETGDVAQSLAVTELALSRFPGESRLVRLRGQAEALRDAAERERFIQEQAALAQQLSEKGQSAKALAVAENAVKHLGLDPRLQALVAHLRQLVERERLLQAEQTVVAQARNAMQASDFDFALKILTAARINFPDSREVGDLLQAAQIASARKAERERLLQAEQAVVAQARKAMQALDFDSALKILMAARVNFPESGEITDLLQAAQARKAEDLSTENKKREIAETLERSLANESDPELQVRLAEEAVRKIPGNDATERVLARVRDRHRQIVSAAARARKFEQEQCYAEALQEWDRVGQLWAQYPQIAVHIARLNAALPPQRTQHKDPTRVGDPALQAPPKSAPPESPAPASGLSATSIMIAASGRAPSPAVETPAKVVPNVPAPAPASPAPASPTRDAFARGGGAARGGFSRDRVDAPVLHDQPDRSGRKKFELPQNWHWGLVTFVALFIAISGIIYLVHRSRSPVRPKAVGLTVRLHANIDGSKFKLDGRLLDSDNVSLIAGKDYVIEATREGYRPEVKKVTPSAAASAGPIEFTLTALAPKLSISSDLKKGKVSVGDQQPVPLQSGELSLEELPFGNITLKVWDGKRLLLELPLDIQPGKAVTLAGSMQAKDCSVAVLSQLGNSTTAYASPDLKGSSGGTPPAQTIPPEGLAVNTEFSVSDGRSWPLQPTSAPTLTVSIITSGEMGTLQVQADVPDTQLKIDKGRKTPMNGSKSILLQAGKHRIQVIAPGYADSDVREVEILKGKTDKETFTLSALQAQLALTQVEPGATVYIDGEQRGATATDGSLKAAVSPGEHKIALKKQYYEDSPIVARQFKAKQTETISGKQLPLQKYGSIHFDVTPASAAITIRMANGPARAVAPNETVFLPKGTYTYRIEADHFQPKSGTATIDLGGSTSIAENLQSVGPQDVGEADLFENPAQWSPKGGYWEFKHSGYGWLKLRDGSFNVIIEKKRSGPFLGKSKAEWTLDYRGDKDRIIYSADGNTLSRRVISSGNESKPVKTQFKERSNAIYQFIFDISPTRIVVQDNGHNTIDEFERPDSSVDLGKIGFHGDISISVQRLR